MANVSKQIIVPIKEADVRRIVSGQAITDLASAVKELIDNSLDAGARSITVRLANNGIDRIEVDDDGIGVTPNSRKYIATKHATSKLSSFNDLYSDSNTEPTSLGFRGEALFCLCNISQNLIITTRTAEERAGQKLEFNRDGTLEKAECIPKKVGTNVQIFKIFHNLPVRRMDLTKRIKSQKARLLKLMQNYAVLCVGIKFNLVDVKKGKSDVILSTSSTSKSIENTVSSVLGAKFLIGLAKIDIDLNGIVEKNQSRAPWKIEGLISTNPMDQDCARDLQFFSINDRPVDLPKITRVLGEVWRSCETTSTSKRPACILKLTLPRSQFDVNVDPSKREVILVEEQKISDILRETLLERWSASSKAMFLTNQVEKTPRKSGTSSERLDFFQFTHSKTPRHSKIIQSEISRKIDSLKELDSVSSNRQERYEKRDFTAIVSPQEEDSNKLTTVQNEQDTPRTFKNNQNCTAEASNEKITSTNLTHETYSSAIFSWKNKKRTREETPTLQPAKQPKQNLQQEKTSVNETMLDGNQVTWHSFRSTEDIMSKASLAKDNLHEIRQYLKVKRHYKSKDSHKEQDETNIPCTPPPIDDLIGEETITPKLLSEEDGKVTLCKQDFLHMDIVGQFNQGFILARCPNNHLWILDQHGCDERYRLEYLAENTILHQQTLLSPLPLELSPMEENCILDHMDLFHLNGFRFECKPDNPVRHRLSLTAVPHSGSGQDGKAVQFGKEDISVLCNILLESEGEISGYGCGVNSNSSKGNNAVRRYINVTNKSTIRLPKAIAMFASRACRQSVMIGTSLSHKEMRSIVQQMHTVQSPWVCAHGRPTMRHVRDLNNYLVKDDSWDNRYIANPCLGVWTQMDDSGESSNGSNELEVLEEL